jgi:hypothetical protein
MPLMCYAALALRVRCAQASLPINGIHDARARARWETFRPIDAPQWWGLVATAADWLLLAAVPRVNNRRMFDVY